MKELVSIVMPSYNTGKFIAASIESVMKQTYTNWELIIVDDCSTDNTDEVVEHYLFDKRVNYIKNETNKGAALSRNKALAEAKGKYIAFLDSDDLWLPNKLEKQISFMKQNNYAFTYTKYSEIEENGESTGIVVSGPKKIGNLKMHLFNFTGCLTVVYDAEVVGLIQIPDLKKRNDWAMWLKVVKHTPCFLLNENLSMYRVRKSGSITHVKGGKLSLLKYHYVLFRETELMSPFKAGIWTAINLPIGYIKRVLYTKNNQKTT